MTPEQRTLVIKAVLGPCSKCRGSGAWCAGVTISEGSSDIDYTCPHCDGAGATIKDATRENWLWWGTYDDIELDPHPVWSVEAQGYYYVPDFPNDPKAAVELAALINASVCWGPNEVIVDGIIDLRTGDETVFHFIERRRPDGKLTVPWGDTLGGALIAALEAREGTR